MKRRYFSSLLLLGSGLAAADQGNQYGQGPISQYT
jgi:hypothetical protein